MGTLAQLYDPGDWLFEAMHARRPEAEPLGPVAGGLAEHLALLRRSVRRAEEGLGGTAEAEGAEEGCPTAEVSRRLRRASEALRAAQRSLDAAEGSLPMAP